MCVIMSTSCEMHIKSCLQNHYFHIEPLVYVVIPLSRMCVYRVFRKKSSPLKLLGIFSLRLTLFAWNFANLLAIRIYIYTNFYRLILIFHQIALMFPYPSFSPCQVLSRPIHPENANGTFRKWRHFLSSHVLVSDDHDCKSSITVRFLITYLVNTVVCDFYCWRLTDIVGPSNGLSL